MSPTAPSTALFISPHLDDVAFSCGGTVARLKRCGWRVALVTVFTRSVPNPTGFALACQLDKGLAPDVDYLALRRAEDAEAGRRLGVDQVAWLDLPEAPHRGYSSAPELFAGVRPDDAIIPEIQERLDPWTAELQPAWIFAPQCIGNHADHRQVVRALLDPPWAARPVAWYRDLPYASKFPAAQPAPDLPGDFVEVAAPLSSGDLDAKVEASAAYETQIPFQFGSVAAIRSVLGGFATAEGERLGIQGPAESFQIGPDSVAAWSKWRLSTDDTESTPSIPPNQPVQRGRHGDSESV